MSGVSTEGTPELKGLWRKSVRGIVVRMNQRGIVLLFEPAPTAKERELFGELARDLAAAVIASHMGIGLAYAKRRYCSPRDAIGDFWIAAARGLSDVLADCAGNPAATLATPALATPPPEKG